MILLDPHTLIWLSEGHPQLGVGARRLADEALGRDCLGVSAISFWETAMLHQRGRIRLLQPVEVWRRILVDLGVIDVPSYRVWAHSPPFGSLILFFFQKRTTRSCYLMNFSQMSMRGVEIWHIWKQHHLIECFWKILKSALPDSLDAATR